MRTPQRKAEIQKRALQGPADHHYTTKAIERMQKTLQQLQHTDRPAAIKEVQRTQEMGDLSENAAYQEAKWTLRKINSRILSLEDKLKHAIPIQAGSPGGIVHIGSRVKVSSDAGEQWFEIVGSLESDPQHHRISHASPLGKALLGKKQYEEISFATPNGTRTYRVLEVT